MESYAQVLVIAIPFFMVLIGIEAIAAWKLGVHVNRGEDMISSLSSGITNVVKDVLGLTVVIVSYAWLVDHISLVTIQDSWLVYLVAFIVLDFAGYWMHRLEHRINLFWNRHIIHHSSEEFNLSCALRQSISNVTSFIALFMVPAALVGVPAQVIGFIAPIHLFAQFWYHTRLINKMGVLESILVTPSHHRVHHAMNAPYLDRNYGQILIIWDKLFGTFQPELDVDPPVYGVKRPVQTWNPILINLQHVWQLVKDAWRTKSRWDKLRIWFMPTGWRPTDVSQLYPVPEINDFSQFQKYDSQPGRALLAWAWAQLVVTLLLMFWFFLHIGDFSMQEIFAVGFFLFISVYSYTNALDRSESAVLVEFVRFVFSWIILYGSKDVFIGVDSEYSFLKTGLIVWIFFSFLFLWITRKEALQAGSKKMANN